MVRELLDKRSGSTANRSPMHLAEVALEGLNFGFRPYDATLKNMRRSISKLLSKEGCSEHMRIQQAEVSQLMYDLLKRPEAYYTHVEHSSLSAIFAVVFGIRCPRLESSPIPQLTGLQDDLDEFLSPGHHPPLDLLPILKHVPERWAEWTSISRDLKNRHRELYYDLFEACERRIQTDAQNGCFAEQLLLEQDKYGLTRDMVA
ncbi:hypothetical protein EUX98_g4090 [Antrodiella citrinella]|uniref:Uncharacterized protein n=1 Tax=Antrodiella citrinella TaxID=2447956 RepID=A0A4V3XIQ5_9APHY|nr:hypothetical protein EUX98_g4090 [Antrodiella citrinella]